MKEKKTIAAAFLRTTALLSGLGLAALGALWAASSLANFEVQADRQRQEFMDARKAEVRNEVDEALDMIRDMRGRLEAELRRKVRQRVLEGVEVARRLYEANRAWRPPEEIRHMVRETLRSMRFLSGRGYFFILDRGGVQVLNAARPDLEGRQVQDMEDVAGRKLFRDMEAVAQESGEGFVEYLWTRPGIEGADHAKLSFVHLFEPYGWIIGGGEYREDAEADLKAEVLRRLELERFGDHGYLFVGAPDGRTLAGPSKGRSMSDIISPDGTKVAEEFNALAASGGGYLHYILPGSGMTAERRVGYAALVKEWGWCLGGGVSVDRVEKEIALRRVGMWTDLRNRGLSIAGLLALLLLAQYLVARRVAGRIQQGVAGFLDSLRRVAEPGVELDPAAQPYVELADAAATARDLVAARARAEAALRDSEARYRRLVENTLDAMFLVDENGRILDANPLACENLGYSREELAGLRIWDVDRKIDPEEFAANRDLVESGETFLQRGLLRRKDGSTYPVEVRVTAFAEDGRSLTLGLARDVSSREAAERELLKAKVAAESASRAKSQFMANMSHELRTPLNAIMGMARILRDSGATPEQGEFLDIIRRSSEHLLRIISDILDLSGIEAGRVRVSEEPFELRQSLSPLLKSCAVQAWRKGLGFEWLVDEDVPERLVGDSGRLAQVLFNLVQNAIKFTESGSVDVRVSRHVDGPPPRDGAMRLACAVRDTGPGIAADKLAAVFERFVQAEEALSRRHGGVGLGLSISRELARLMDGDITATSEPGAGCTFVFTAAFGLEAPAAAALPPAQPGRAAQASRPLRLLVVEDEPVSRLLAGRMLRMAGHTVQEVGDGAEALDVLSRERFDAVLMDVQMPGINGLDAIRRIRAGKVAGCDARVPVIALTAYALESEREACLTAGMDDFAAKPLDIDDLLRRLDRVVASRSGQEGLPQ